MLIQCSFCTYFKDCFNSNLQRLIPTYLITTYLVSYLIPTYLLNYLPTTYLLSYLIPTYLPTYLRIYICTYEHIHVHTSLTLCIYVLQIKHTSHKRYVHTRKTSFVKFKVRFVQNQHDYLNRLH